MSAKRKRTDQERLVILIKGAKVLYLNDRHRDDLMIPTLNEAMAIAERLRDREAEVKG